MRIAPRESSSLAVAGLVVVNVVPLLGVLLFGWQLYTILVIYWVESGIIGALNLPKIMLASGSETPEDFTATVNGREVDLSGPTDPRDGLHLYAENADVAGFFLLHYGVFWTVHGVFVLTMFAPPLGSAGLPYATVAAGTLGMVVSHAGSFLTNFVGNEEYRGTSPGIQMKEPYRRVLVLHFTVVLGAFGAAAVGTPLFALVLLVALKTVGDVYAHLREHRRAAKRRPDTGGPRPRSEREPNTPT
jgi:hypothetical protein